MAHTELLKRLRVSRASSRRAPIGAGLGLPRRSLAIATAVAMLAAMLAFFSGGTDAVVFPGGNGRIAYVAGPAIRTAAPDGTGIATAVSSSNGSVTWSPDGNRLAYGRIVSGAGQIFMAAADGSGETQLTFGASACCATWFPDGARLAYYSGGLRTVNANGTGDALLLSGNTVSPAVSPDGTKIAFSLNGNILTVVDSNGTNPVALIGPSANMSGRATWSPDGNNIAFERVDLSLPPAEWNRGIWAISPDGSNLRQLTAPGSDSSPSWSPDGTKIAFARSAAAGNGDIWVMNADGSSPTAIIATATNETLPDWGPTPAVIDGPSWVVNTTDDVNDGSCTLVHCSLREALLRSNAECGDRYGVVRDTWVGCAHDSPVE